MKKILAISLITILILTSALCASFGVLTVSAAKGDNLAAGKTVDLLPHKNGDGTLDGYNTDLTDGKIADTFNWADGSWLAFQINNNTDEAGYGVLTVDLGQAATIGQVRVHTLFANGSNGGVGNPKSVKLELSTDNIGWQPPQVKEYEPSTNPDWDPQWIEFNVDNVEARYVRLTFEQTQAFVMIDEVEVLEGEHTAAPEEPSSEASSEPSEEPSESSAAPEPSDEPSEAPSEAVSSEEPSDVTSDETPEPSAAESEETSEATSDAPNAETSEETSEAESVSSEAAGTASSADGSSDPAAESDGESQGNGLLIGLLCAGVAVLAAVGVVIARIRRKKG